MERETKTSRRTRVELRTSGFTRTVVVAVVVAGAWLVAPVGCQPEVTKYEPRLFHSPISGLSSGPGSAAGSGSGAAGASADDNPTELTQLVTEHPDGSVTFLSFLPMHLISHLRRTLLEEKYDLIYEQLISEEAKQLYRQRGLDPEVETLAWLEESRLDIVQMLNHMSFGINSPNVVYEQYENVMVLRVEARAGERLRFRTLETSRVNGQFKLLTIY